MCARFMPWRLSITRAPADSIVSQEELGGYPGPARLRTSAVCAWLHVFFFFFTLEIKSL